MIPREHGCVLKILPDCGTILRVQSWDINAVMPLDAESLVGIPWPRQTGSVAHGRVNVLCTGPTDWLVMATDFETGTLVQELGTILAASTLGATDLSQALTRVEIEGPDAHTLMSKGCALDLQQPRFAPGRCTRTRFADMPVVVHCVGPAAYECIVSASYREYLLFWLADAAVEISSFA
jgi:heterotetrameric sarcosine oxidase gamma subunit